MKFYHDIETDEIISENALFLEFTKNKKIQPNEYNYSFDHFIKNCLTSNNGSLEAIGTYAMKLEKELKTIKSDEYTEPDEIESLQREIENLKKYL